MPLTGEERDRYRRHLALPEIGEKGQQQLCSARVLVVGAGGLGCPSALYLAAAGVGTLGIVDCDRVELSNLQRQILYDTRDLGRLKVDATRDRLTALNPHVDVVPHAMEVVAANVLDLVGAYDVVVDGCDRIATRYVVNDACVLRAKPLVAAAIHRFEGQMFTYLPGRGPCYRCIFAGASPDGAASCTDAGVLGALPGLLGTLQAIEVIKLIVGAGLPLVGRLLTIDALDLQFHEFAVVRHADCAVCGSNPTIAAPRDEDRSDDGPELLAAARCLTPAQLHTLLQRHDGATPPIQLVDVRGPDEFAAGHLPGAMSMPVDDVDRCMDRIPAMRRPVFLCRSGARSQRACAIAVRAGRTDAAHLEGGLLAWAAEIDPELSIL